MVNVIHPAFDVIHGAVQAWCPDAETAFSQAWSIFRALESSGCLDTDARLILIPEGVKVHSLENGRHLATCIRDFGVGDYVAPEFFSDWADGMPERGAPVGQEFMDAIWALSMAFVVRTGVCLVRMDTGARVEYPGRNGRGSPE